MLVDHLPKKKKKKKKCYDLTRRTASDKIFVIKHLILLKIQNKMNIKYQRGVASMVCKAFDRNAYGGGAKTRNMSNQHLLELAT